MLYTNFLFNGELPWYGKIILVEVHLLLQNSFGAKVSQSNHIENIMFFLVY